MKHSMRCTRFVAGYESLRLVAYQDGAGVWTIGFGHTTSVKAGDTCTNEQALAWFDEDLSVADNDLARYLKVVVTQDQWDGMVSLDFNIGANQFRTSSVVKFINGNNPKAAADAFLAFDKEHNPHTHEFVVSLGLAGRRRAERLIFLGAA